MAYGMLGYLFCVLQLLYATVDCRQLSSGIMQHDRPLGHASVFWLLFQSAYLHWLLCCVLCQREVAFRHVLRVQCNP